MIPTPFYVDDYATIYLGEAETIIPALDRFDLLLTDPPYGIGADAGQRSRAGKRNGRSLTVSSDYGETNWDEKPADKSTIDLARASADQQVIWGGNFFELPPSRCWLVWDKDNGANDYADCELAWTNIDMPIRRITYRWHGMFQEPMVAKERRVHPTQKPETVMRWAIAQARGAVRSIIDPYMGSGTTLVAAKRAGIRSVGIERERIYCELAVERLAQDRLPLGETDLC